MNAVKFLEERFGKDRGNGKGISKILEDYAKVKTEELVIEKEMLESEIKSLKLKLEKSMLNQCKCP